MSNGKKNANRDLFFVWFRVIALICILLHHSMTAYVDWPPSSPLVCKLPPLISNISNLCKIVGLSSFTFIAGYFAYFSMKKYSLGTFVLKKVQHLMIPCCIWSFCYYFLFPQFMFNNAPVNGTHLWYLPMLLLCLILGTSIGYLRNIFVGSGIYLGVFLLIAGAFYGHLFSPNPIFRPIISLLIYLPVFGVGCLLAKYQTNKLLISFFHIVIFVGVLIIFVDPTKHLFSLFGFGTLFFAIFMYTVGKASVSKYSWCPAWLLSLDQNSFSIYLIHQFVINTILLGVSCQIISKGITFPIVFTITIGVSWCFAIGLGALQNAIQKLVQNKFSSVN